MSAGHNASAGRLDDLARFAYSYDAQDQLVRIDFPDTIFARETP